MHGKNLQRRITRLQELIMRLSQEDASWKDDMYPLHHMERNAYLSAMPGEAQELTVLCRWWRGARH
jgi:hypothetical protein